MNGNIKKEIRKRHREGWGIRDLKEHYGATYDEIIEVLEK